MTKQWAVQQNLPTSEFDDHGSVRNPIRDLRGRFLQEVNLIICKIVLVQVSNLV